MKHIQEKETVPEAKKSKTQEALQQILEIRPDLRGKSVYFFFKHDKYREGTLIYDKDKKSYVYDIINGNKFDSFYSWINFLKKKGLFSGKRSALATIFLEPNNSSPNLASILRITDQAPYWNNRPNATIVDVSSFIRQKIKLNGEFYGTGLREIDGGLGLTFFGRENNIEKIMTIKWHGILISFEVSVLGKVVKDTDLISLGIFKKRTISEVEEAIRHVYNVNICRGMSTKGYGEVTHSRGAQLVNNDLGPDDTHEPFAIMENQGKSNEIYCRIDCHLLVNSMAICVNCKKLKNTMIQIRKRYLAGLKFVKIDHASNEFLTEKVQQQKKVIKRSNEVIKNLQDRLKKKIEGEEEEISDEMANIIENVASDVTKNTTDISSLHPIFQELIRIQCGKPKGTRYHPMFLRWAISVYTRAGNSAYNAMKNIMRLPSISTLKSYINECEQKSGWQDKIAHQMLSNLTIENIWGYGRIGFFSHDSFKIQKGLLWSQRSNSYVGYLDFEDEVHDLQLFAIQCENEIMMNNDDNLSDPMCEKSDRNLATQVHQIVWHSVTHNFSFPISYYGINTLTTHELNKLLFDLAARLECIGVHTCGSVCDGAGENRNHIKSFDWFASTWSPGDIVEVRFGRENFYVAKILSSNLSNTKFCVQKLDQEITEDIEVDRTSLRPIIEKKILGKEVSEYEFRSWHKTINPITGEPWFFISDPTHVFKKLRNNLSKSHTGRGGERNIREIMHEGKEVSWKHIEGVCNYTSNHATAKATKLTKRHIWLTSWSKMRVDLAEQTLSKEVEKALELIEELKDISVGTRKFIKNSREYRQIFHSKISFRSINDPRFQTLKNIRDWFVLGDMQKTGPMGWISPQCQFDLILSISGFLDMLEYILSKYKGAAIQPRRISQDMLEGLFGTIRQLSGDSSTQTLQGYGHALNKYRMTALVSSEVKSVNYGNADSIGSGIHSLSRRDYRKKTQSESNTALSSLNLHSLRLSALSSLSRQIFESLLQDDLLMGRFTIPSETFNDQINNENIKIYNSNLKRCELIEFLLYNNTTDILIQKWQSDIKTIAQNAIPKKRGVRWISTWSSKLENHLNNYLCSGVWFANFQEIFILQFSIDIQRIIAFSILQKVIMETFKGNHSKKIIEKGADPNLLPQAIINLDPAETSKFSYIVGWVLFKLIKNDKVMISYPNFEILSSLLSKLCSESIEYVREIRMQTTNIVPGSEIMNFMYQLESLVLQLFEKHDEFGPYILCYIRNSLLNNLHLLQKFSALLEFAMNSEDIEGKLFLQNEDQVFLFERLVSIYMKSRQKTWRQHNGYIPEKGSASLRENLKVMRSNGQNSANKEKSKNTNQIKKANLPTDPMLALLQLQLWAQLEDAETLFSKNFLVTELLWLSWAFGIQTNHKRKNILVPLVISCLKNKTPFSDEALIRKSIFSIE